MMKNKVLCILFFCLLSAGAMAQETKWKVVDTEINSFEIPTDWINSRYEEPGTEYIKFDLGKEGIRYWTIYWKKQESSGNYSWNSFQEVNVSVMSRLDGKKLNWETMRKLRGQPEKPATKQLFETENEICYKCVYDAEDMHGKVNKWVEYIYYREENNQVHRMGFSATARNFKKNKGLVSDVMHIFKSLKVKENDMSK